MVNILGANSVSGGYEIDNSLRFNEADSPKLTFTPSSATNQRTFSYSTWFKRSDVGNEAAIFLNAGSNAANYFRLNLESNDRISVFGISGGSTDFIKLTTAFFRDPSAWYHLVLVIDTTDSTAGDRIKIYINGSRITDFANSTDPSENHQTDINGTTEHIIGNSPAFTAYYGGYLAETHFIDGTAKAPTDFGETDDNGVWIPIKYTGSYGTNGYYLEFKQTGTSQNSSGIGADTSGNDNHYAVTNLAATDVVIDTPTNNWCVPNTLDKGTTYPLTLSEGNLKIAGASEANSIRASMMMTKGKWYWECRLVSAGIYNAIGIASDTAQTLNALIGNDSESIGYASHTGETTKGGSATTSGATWSSAGDVMGIAFDADNGNLVFYKNNSSQNNNYSSLTQGYWMPAFTSRNGSIIVNFGQDSSFAGTETAQNNTDANGEGSFKYTPPSGHFALNTKNLAEFG